MTWKEWRNLALLLGGPVLYFVWAFWWEANFTWPLNTLLVVPWVLFLVWIATRSDEKPNGVAGLVSAGLGFLLGFVVYFTFYAYVGAVLAFVFIFPVFQNRVSRALGRALRRAFDVAKRTVGPITLAQPCILLAAWIATMLAFQVLVPPLDEVWRAQHPEAYEELREMVRADDTWFEDGGFYLSAVSCRRFQAKYPEAHRAARRLLFDSSWWQDRTLHRTRANVYEAYYCDR